MATWQSRRLCVRLVVGARHAVPADKMVGGAHPTGVEIASQGSQ